MNILIGFAVIAFVIFTLIAINSNNRFNEEREYKVKNDLPLDVKSYKIARKFKEITENTFILVWIDSDSLYIFSNDRNEVKYEISICDIRYYTFKGELRQDFEYKGKKPSSIDTMVTEAMLGTAAAMKNNQATIKSSDERKTIINATVDDGEVFLLFHGIDLYNYLLENIPDKEQSFVSMSK